MESIIPKVRRDGKLRIRDRLGNTYTVDYEDGDVKLANTKAGKIVVRNRGVIVSVRKGDDPEYQITFSVHMRQFTSESDLNLCDILDGDGAAKDWVSTGGRGFSDFPNFDYTFTADGAVHGDGADHEIEYPVCIGEWSFSEGDPAKIDVTLAGYRKPIKSGPA
jgi:hypothetical protein